MVAFLDVGFAGKKMSVICKIKCTYISVHRLRIQLLLPGLQKVFCLKILFYYCEIYQSVNARFDREKKITMV